MRTLGLIHRVETNGAITSISVEADSAQPAVDVFRSAFGPELTHRDLIVGNRIENRRLESISWGHWQRLNPITVVGAHSLRTTDACADSAQTTVSVVAGPDSGFTLTLDPRRVCLSRLTHADCLTLVDPCISRTPQPLRLDATGAQPAVHVGASVLAPTTAEGSAAGASSSTGRSAPLIRSPPLQRSDDIHIAPKTIDDPRPARPPQWWTFLIPVGIGVVLAVVTGMWWFLLFSVSAPLSGWLAYLVEKKRFTRDSAQCRLDRDDALAEARTRLSRLEAKHRHTIFSSPGLCLGFGTVFSDLTIDERLQDGTDHVDGRVVCADMPIRIDPRTTTVTVSGTPAVLRTMAFAWLADRRFRWRPSPELALLPELAGTEFSADHSAHLPRSDNHPAGTADDPIPITLDEAAHPAVLTLTAPHSGSAVSMTVGTLAQARTTSSTAPGGPVPGRALIAALMPAARFVTLHRSRSAETEPRAWPDHGLGELCDDAPEAIRDRWRHPASGPVLIGRGDGGDVGIDLFADGPHALVAGTTGSGKSLLLQTWLLSMALAQSPRRLRFVLIDFKGGATFSPLQDLPHTDSVIDDFDSGLAFRALVSVRAEITHRERLLAHHGCADVADLADPPPRLVVVIDEFHALMATHPRAADLLEHLTALGRSLGVHLILATQRPMGVVTGQMKANINIRVCLRVRDETDSFDVIGTEAGAFLPADKPGAACLDSGISITQFRVAVPFGRDTRTEAALRPRVRPWVRGPVPSLASGVDGVDVDNIVAAARDSAECGESSVRRQVVLPPLPAPEEMTAGAAGVTIGNPDGPVAACGESVTAVTGIIDLPAQQAQLRWTFDPDVDGSSILTGGSPETVESVLVNMARAAAATRRIVAIGRIAAALDWAEISCGMNTGWQIQSVLDHLTVDGVPGRIAPVDEGTDTSTDAETSRHPPSLLVCSNWAEFVDSLDHYWAERAERLLGQSTGSDLVFLLAGCRNMTTRSSRFASQVIFPPDAGEDGTSFGLSRQRFAGSWPDLRAVIRGPRVQAAGGEGADVQFVPGGATRNDSLDSGVERNIIGGSSDDPKSRGGFARRWRGLDRPASKDEASFGTSALTDRIPIGVDAFGVLVVWEPLRHGSVLTVRGSPQSGKTGFATFVDRLGGVSVHDDAHLEPDPVDWDLLDGRFHVLTVSTRFTPSYGSPLAKAQSLGPLLVLGVHTKQDLTGLGVLRQAPLDGLAGTGWFVTEEQTRPVRLFSPTRVEPASAHVGRRS
ncbi:AAA-like domain-containing protein [Brevibacterium siliguriense]|uniref:AAA-like domain-containing protein n=1 Tax=Brevibacterium siliguriense TaxID=1136497 RepID=A0A1H1R962_9MICO|nr:FtsK/SpoIIIE domain-containing protein [Brevibacterium siliguriense]SDS32238.1 AAA-like domain-containing protein [Brevibacterium siliguriense]